MSVLFGRWNWEGRPPSPYYIEKTSAILAPYGPDSNDAYSEGDVSILYYAFHTTKESRCEMQPHISASGNVITWDGRLDNRTELVNELRDFVTMSSADVAIVAAAYERWGSDCFAKLIGDWALSIYNRSRHSVILAKDPVGTRHLYYCIDKDQVTWSTILDPLVLFAGKTLEICEEYIAGWFAILFPAPHLTPYVGIHSVPPSSSVLLRPGTHVVSKYWDFDPGKRIRYRSDKEYEEHFRIVFTKAIQRRLRSDRPVLAELSGGVDSSSVVCVADAAMAEGNGEIPRLDTVTWYDDSDPNWGERALVTKVEEKRGRTGCHVDLGARKQSEEIDSQEEFRTRFFPFSEFQDDRLAAIPTSNRGLPGPFRQHEAYITAQGYRVTLSGIGGEEATGGGVPTPTPELQDLLARGRFFTLIEQLNAWAAKMRRPRLPLLWESVRGFFPLSLSSLPKNIGPASYLHPSFVRRNRDALCGYPCRVKLSGPLPSFQNHTCALNHVRRFLAYRELHSEWLREVRFPYLDRDLLEFTYAVPQDQLVRVGQRRSLMRRALVSIVPAEVLHRRKGATLPQEPPNIGPAEWSILAGMGRRLISNADEVVDPDRFLKSLHEARHNEEVAIGGVRRVLTLESWLRHLTNQGILMNSVSRKATGGPSSFKTKDLQTSTQAKVQLADVRITLEKGGENNEIRNSRTDGFDACDQCHSGK